MGELFNNIMAPLEFAVSWILISIHTALVNLGVPADSGLSWGPSIIVLVIIVRILLIPLFVKQIKAQRGLQLLQPKMQELRKKYGADRQRMSEELMKLYKETGTNPFSSCLPILAQSPFFFGLYRVLDGIANDHERGVLTPELIESGRNALIFGAPLSDSFLDATAGSITPYVTAVMIVLMSASQFLTQRQIMMKNMPGGGDNPMAQQQKILLYVFPLVFAVSGVYFPVGVLLYWLTTNLWTMGQQFYVIRRMPAPGSKAEEAFNARKAAKAATKGDPTPTAAAPAAPVVEPTPPRQQPKRQTRTQRKTPPAKTPPAKSPPAKSPPAKTRPAKKPGGENSQSNGSSAPKAAGSGGSSNGAPPGTGRTSGGSDSSTNPGPGSTVGDSST